MNLKRTTRYTLFLMAFGILSCKNEKPPIVPNSETLFILLDTKDTGIEFQNKLTETQERNHLINENFVTGAGVAIGDINNDGLADIYFSGNEVGDKLYLNKGGFVFDDITEKSNITGSDTWSTGVTFADVNSDGLEDIYVCKNVQGNATKSANLLFINNGDLTFSEKSKAYHVANEGFSIQSNFFDYDKDGLLDMYLVNQPPGYGNRQGDKRNKKRQNPLHSDKLYKNLGGENGFVEISPVAKTENSAYGLSSAIGDVNNDGWQDIYVANDYDEPDYLYLNDTKGSFSESLKQRFKHISNFSMGSDIADYDNDGNLDIMVLDMVAEDHKRIKTNMGGMNPDRFWKIVNEGGHYQYMFNTLHRNNGNGTFSDLAQLAGISNTDWSWGTLIADFDNDGYKDIFVTNGIKRNMRNSDVNRNYERILDSLELVAKRENERFRDIVDVLALAKMAPIDKLENYMFKNNGDLTFTKKNKEWGFDRETLSNGSAYADLDNDGDLDLVINNIDEKAFVYRNLSVEKNGGNFLRVNLKPSNGKPIYGTRVSLFDESGIWQMGEVSNTRGYMSKSENIVHFGLGNKKTVKKIEVQWANGKISVIENPHADQVLEINQENSVDMQKTSNNSSSDPLFEEVTERFRLDHRHTENDFDDYAKQVLLPHKMSNFGPSMAVADVNSDGLEDFFIGGAAGFPGILYVQKTNGTFNGQKDMVWYNDKDAEDMGCVFFDIDNDGDQDLFVVSGGNEYVADNQLYQDRLYLNDGKGNFTKTMDRMPKYFSSGSTVAKADFDSDGDFDIVVAGRQIPGKYPFPASCFLLENKNGKLTNVTKQKAPDLINIGMTTDVKWVDFNSDNKLDFVAVGEWMPITVLIQTEKGNFKRMELEGLEKSHGWYGRIASSDIDGDGDQDFIVGNLGLNYKYKASKEKPFQVHSADFDKNGSQDIVLSYFDEDEVFPIRGRSCSVEQIPMLNQKFPTYESFGNSNLADIYGTDLDYALNLKAYTFASYYVENKKGKSFKLHPLPQLAQVSSINAILIEDFDSDGFKDLVVAGNLYASEIETPRNDAGIGLFLKGNGKGGFESVALNKSGFYAPHDVKDMKKIKIGSEKGILVGNNSDQIQLLRYK